MRLESAAKGASEISGEGKVNKVYGKYSRKYQGNKKNTQHLNRRETQPSNKDKTTSCFFCGLNGKRQDILTYAKLCPARSSVCSKCNTTGHYAKVCRKEPKEKPLNELQEAESIEDDASVSTTSTCSE